MLSVSDLKATLRPRRSSFHTISISPARSAFETRIELRAVRLAGPCRGGE